MSGWVQSCQSCRNMECRVFRVGHVGCRSVVSSQSCSECQSRVMRGRVLMCRASLVASGSPVRLGSVMAVELRRVTSGRLSIGMFRQSCLVRQRLVSLRALSLVFLRQSRPALVSRVQLRPVASRQSGLGKIRRILFYAVMPSQSRHGCSVEFSYEPSWQSC